MVTLPSGESCAPLELDQGTSGRARMAQWLPWEALEVVTSSSPHAGDNKVCVCVTEERGQGNIYSKLSKKQGALHFQVFTHFENH